jgi:hypothetical protein
MCTLSRRALLGSGAAAALGVFSPTRAGASLARGLSLEELVRAAARGVVGVPLASECRYADFGGQRAIVTDTRVGVDEHFFARVPESSELILRTLGGIVGDLGERVDGQAVLRLGEPCVIFSSLSRENVEFVTGMAQGHYPLRADARGVLRLRPSHNLPRLLRPERAAAFRLSGRDLSSVRALVRGLVP